ncbi:hypothetical protein AWM75_04855 [Aerococcus urinaehominis]|uniref:Uncharacterized protein n=1 Tax=Aerococcus urinaehominis TaxID=128944 RepID=A0A0X8FL76_9LACT|nr:alkaline shock response membrane anchor protein AmaP [Aerococcus urinaehominis]AMB99362.1 hypothetical protein AWM75_04855 [Aerococcus urinaehominis]SDM22359.1 Asp23 family, cell envelope-related function [Aerococcus urinaehominis]
MGGFRRFLQIVLSLLALVAVVLSVATFYPIPYISGFVSYLVVQQSYLNLVVAGILALLAILALVLFFQAIFAPSKHDELVIETDRGEMILQKQAVESTAIRAMRSMPQVKFPQAKAIFIKDPHHTKLNLEYSVEEGRDIVNLSQRIQERVADEVSNFLGVPIAKVNVSVKQVNRDDMRRVRQELTPTQPRVR